MLAMALGQVFFERISRNKSNMKEANALARELLHLLLALTAIPAILLFFLGEDLAIILLGETWREAGTYIESTILFYTAMFISNPFFCLFDVYQRLKQELIFNFLFLVGGAAAMYWAHVQGYNSLIALQWFSVIGIILRFGVLNYLFRLVGGYILPTLLLLSSLAGIVYYFIS
jgi:O-antigen/teichoic acid export membrane protein